MPSQKSNSKKSKKPKPIVYGRKKPSEYIEYNESSRQEFITGFHKRKQEKLLLRKEKAKQRVLEEKREHLREKRKKLSQVYEIVEEIDSVGTFDSNPSEKEIQGPETRTTVFIQELDPNEL